MFSNSVSEVLALTSTAAYHPCDHTPKAYYTKTQTNNEPFPSTALNLQTSESWSKSAGQEKWATHSQEGSNSENKPDFKHYR